MQLARVERHSTLLAWVKRHGETPSHPVNTGSFFFRGCGGGGCARLAPSERLLEEWATFCPHTRGDGIVSLFLLERRDRPHRAIEESDLILDQRGSESTNAKPLTAPPASA